MVDSRLLLVPCNRPADALTVLGFSPPGLEVEVVSAVLRSWEERFAATLVEVAPGRITIVVDDPPTDMGQALDLAAEQHALAAAEGAGRPGALRDMARRLCGGHPTRRADPIRRHVWELGFRD